MPKSMKLNENWDICINESGDISMCSDAYAIAQNVANAVRLFTDDAYFNLDRGIPHYDIELGHKPAEAQATLTNRIKQAALDVEGVTGAEVELKFSGRSYSGEITIATVDGSSARIEL